MPRAAGIPAGLFVDSGAWIALRSCHDQRRFEADRLFRIDLEKRIPLRTTKQLIGELHRARSTSLMRAQA